MWRGGNDKRPNLGAGSQNKHIVCWRAKMERHYLFACAAFGALAKKMASLILSY